MNDQYKQLLTQWHKRGDWCLMSPFYLTPEGKKVYPPKGSGLCGCGARTPPTVKQRRRIVKRKLKRDLSKDLNGEMERDARESMRIEE